MRTVRTDRTRKPLLLLLVFALFMALTPVTASATDPTTWYVDAVNGSDDNTGLSADDAFATIGAAAGLAIDIDTIVVAAGVYDDEMWPVFIPPGVAVTGAGMDETVIDAGGQDTVLAIGWFGGLDAAEAAPQGALPALNTISDLTVTGGYGELGGGAHVNVAHVLFERCAFVDNSAELGGGVYAESSWAGFVDCLFESNGEEVVDLDEFMEGDVTAAIDLDPGPTPCFAGGGLFAGDSEVSLEGCDFVENGAFYAGAAVLSVEGSIDAVGAAFFNNQITQWFGEEPGPAALSDAAAAMLEDPSVLSRGTPAQPGPTEMFDGVFTAIYSDASLDGCAFEEGFGFAGGVLGMGSRVTATDSTFTNTYSFFGPMMSMSEGFLTGSAAMDVLPEEFAPAVPTPIMSSMLVDSSVFSGNSGLAMTLGFNTDMAVTNSLYAHNNLDEDIAWYGEAAIVGLGYGYLDVVNTTIADNNFFLGVGHDGGVPNQLNGYGGLLLNSIVYNTLEGLDPIGVTGVDIDHSLVQAGEITFAELSEEETPTPNFRDPANLDYRLEDDSPCIDTGTFNEHPLIPFVDLDGLDRPADGNGDGDAEWDMGCYEFASDRVWGANRYATAVDISKRHFNSSEAVVVATGRVFADGLSASGLAGALDAPLLLTRPGDLPGVVADEIVRLGATEAYVCGGPRAINAAVATALENLGLDVTRIGGRDRYETSAMIAEEIIDLAGEPELAFIARGDLFADALSASPVAYGNAAPVLLVKPTELPAATIDAVKATGVSNTVIVGGTAAVGTSVERSLGTLTDTVRISGSDRYDTSAKFSEWAADEEFASFAFTGIATGQDFADALSGGAAIGHRNGVLLLTPSNSLNAAVRTTLTERAGDDEISIVEVFGGPIAIAQSVFDEIMAIVDPVPVP